MANKKISDLTAAGSALSTHQFEVNESGTSKRVTGEQIWDGVDTRYLFGCAVRHNAAQTINDSAWTAVAFNTEVSDDGAFHDTVTNNDRITVPAGEGGIYVVTFSGSFASNSTGNRGARIQKNGTAVAQTMIAAVNGDVTGLDVTYIVKLVPTDYMNVVVWQSSTAALNLQSAYIHFGAARCSRS